MQTALAHRVLHSIHSHASIQTINFTTAADTLGINKFININTLTTPTPIHRVNQQIFFEKW